MYKYDDFRYIKNLKKGVRITIKSKETSSKLVI